jgi:putative transposase
MGHDITYIPMSRGFMYLVAVMDWHSRKVLSFKLSNTLDADFCVDALTEALERYGPPQIFNTDQGAQFTSTEFTDTLKSAGVTISMDGRAGPWTIFLSNGFGGPSNTTIFTCIRLTAEASCAAV